MYIDDFPSPIPSGELKLNNRKISVEEFYKTLVEKYEGYL